MLFTVGKVRNLSEINRIAIRAYQDEQINENSFTYEHFVSLKLKKILTASSDGCGVLVKRKAYSNLTNPKISPQEYTADQFS